MSNSTPSLLALLGLVAFAGYQNRAKISEMLDDARRSQPAASPGTPHASGGLLAQLGQLFQSGSAGSTLSDAASASVVGGAGGSTDDGALRSTVDWPKMDAGKAPPGRRRHRGLLG